jgi:hypothetical protein
MLAVIRRISAWMLAVGCAAAVAAPVDTRFTYQGELRDGAAGASGIYEFEFLLFDAATGTGQIGPTNVFTAGNGNPVTVTNGVFQVALDFGDAFAGQMRFLQIRVKRQADPGFTTLTPRQELTAAPHAINAEFVTDGHVDDGSVAPDSLTAANLAANSVGASEIGTAAVGVDEIGTAAVGLDEIGANAVGADEIGTSAVGAAEINSTEVQRRVTGACPAGSAYRDISSTGTFICETDDDTDTGVNAVTPTAGVSASIVGRTLNVSTDSTVQRRTVAPSCASSEALASIAADGTPSCVNRSTGGGADAGTGTGPPNYTITNSTAFISTTTTQNVPTVGTRILVTATAGMGSTAVGGGQDLSLYICYQSTAAGAPVTTVGGGIFALRVPQNVRVPMSLSALVTNLTPGLYRFGLCGSSSVPASWNSNEWSYVTAAVL